ncbi:Hypothetical protein A7982_01849 [Minicystis rosea]|nr:Hypothetical protein A7982_01849 [Minicystis rosea]
MAPSRPFGLLALVLMGALPACDSLFGGDFGNDPHEAMRRMHKIPDLFPAGVLKVETVWEPGDGIAHTRFMYVTSSPSCPDPIVERICEETGSIRKGTGAKVEAWCHGTSTALDRCEDGRRLPATTR